MKHTHIIALLSLLLITSCGRYNVEESTFSVAAEQSLAMTSSKDLLQRSLDDLAVREVNLWNKTVLTVYPILIFEDQTTDFSLASENTIHEVIDIIDRHENTSKIMVTSFNHNGNSAQAQTLAAIIWDYARLDDIDISYNNVSPKASHDASYINRIEITLE